MRRRCAVPPDTTVLAITRADQAIDHRVGLAPRFLAVVTDARARNPVDVHAVALFADHWRGIITARDGLVLAGFLRRTNRQLARAVIALGLGGWASPIWHRRSELTVLRDDAAASRALAELIGRVRTCEPIAHLIDDRRLLAPAAGAAPRERTPTLLLELDDRDR